MFWIPGKPHLSGGWEGIQISLIFFPAAVLNKVMKLIYLAKIVSVSGHEEWCVCVCKFKFICQGQCLKYSSQMKNDTWHLVSYWEISIWAGEQRQIVIKHYMNKQVHSQV